MNIAERLLQQFDALDEEAPDYSEKLAMLMKVIGTLKVYNEGESTYEGIRTTYEDGSMNLIIAETEDSITMTAFTTEEYAEFLKEHKHVH
jgi:predicted S18 family serine protease